MSDWMRWNESGLGEKTYNHLLRNLKSETLQWRRQAKWNSFHPFNQSQNKNKINLFFFLIDFIEWNFISFDGINLKDIITVNKGLLFIKYVNAISITFRIIKRFNFIYRILVLLKYIFNSIHSISRNQMNEMKNKKIYLFVWVEWMVWLSGIGLLAS